MSDLPPDPFGPTPIAPLRLDQLAIEVIPLNIDGPDRGWCDRCALPSTLEYRFRTLVNGAELPNHLMTLAVCSDCGDVRRENDG